MANLEAFADGFTCFLLTYWLHSTALLALAWAVANSGRITSHFLLEHIWKLAASMGVLTAVIQTASGAGPTIDLVAAFQSAPTHNDGSRADFIHDVRLDVELPSGSRDEESFRDHPIARTSAGHIVNHEETTSLGFQDSVTVIADRREMKFTPGSHFPGTRNADFKAPAASTGFGFRMWSSRQLARAVAIVGVMIMVGGVGRLIWTVLKLRRSLRGFKSCHPTTRRSLDGLLRKNGIRRRVRLLACEENGEPFACGLFHWTIVVPHGIDTRLNKDELYALLAHEIAHLVRGDVFWLWIGQLLCTCFAFQLLNFLARRRWQSSAEVLCDDWAVERGVACLALARCLTHVAEWRLNAHTPVVALAVRGRAVDLVQRVNRLVTARPPDGWTTRRRRTWIHFATLVLIAAAPLVAPRIGFAEISHESVASDGRSVNLPRITALGDAQAIWQALDDELAALEMDVEHSHQLLSKAPPDPHVESLMRNIRERVSALSARREKLHQFVAEEPLK